MKKIKIFVVCITLIFMIMPATNAISDTSEKQDKKTNIQLNIFERDGRINLKNILINKDEINLLEEIMNNINEKIQNMENFDLNEIINYIREKLGNNNLLSMFTQLQDMRPLQKGVFIISNGYGSKIDLSMKRDISFRKQFCFWRYLQNSNNLKNSKTIIIDPIPDSQLNFVKILEGWQVGLMNKFTGFYLRIPGSIGEQRISHTFFIGYASKIRSFDLPDINLPKLQ